jgi:ferredoxin
MSSSIKRYDHSLRASPLTKMNVRPFWITGMIISMANCCFAFSPRPSLIISTSISKKASSSQIFATIPKDDNEAEIPGIDVSQDERLYRIRISRAPGIEWGTDLSFSFVYVRDLEPLGPASNGGIIQIGDQLCELAAANTQPIQLIGAPFDYVMETFANLGKNVKEVDLVFFRGTKDDLKAICTQSNTKSSTDTITLTIIQNKGSDTEQIRTLVVPTGSNIREVCVANGINVYQSVTRWTNCSGKQLCGTCIVNVTEGSLFTNRKSMDEESTLRENPDSYRLSCITFAYGDVTIETFPPVKAAQWTR